MGHQTLEEAGLTDHATIQAVKMPLSFIIATSYQHRDARMFVFKDNHDNGVSVLCQRELVGHDDSLWAAAFSPDKIFLATASSDCSVRIWKVASGTCLHVLHGHMR